MAKPTGDVSKLPKWAQQYISALEHDVRYYQDQLRVVTEADSPVVWESGLEGEHGIPRSARVMFRIWKHHSIDVKLNGDAVSVSGSDAIRIRPGASNVVYVELASIDRIRNQIAKESGATE